MTDATRPIILLGGPYDGNLFDACRPSVEVAIWAHDGLGTITYHDTGRLGDDGRAIYSCDP